MVGNLLQPGNYLSAAINSTPSNIRALGGPAIFLTPTTLKFTGNKGFSSTQALVWAYRSRVGSTARGRARWPGRPRFLR